MFTFYYSKGLPVRDNNLFFLFVILPNYALTTLSIKIPYCVL